MSSDHEFVIVTGAVARNAIASAFLHGRGDTGDSADREIGSITLYPSQVEAVQRIRRSFEEFGGALLCDPVGTGKTFIGLALSDEAVPAVIVAPAVLRRMWTQAAELCNRAIVFYSMEALSRSESDLSNEGSLLIVDEAHHVRNPSTRRYRAASNLARSRKTLLLTATPIHNSRSELTSLLALFLGSRASALTAAQSGRCVIRRAPQGTSSQSKPSVRPLEWRQPMTKSPVPELLLALPPPLPPSDGEDGGILVVHSLIRQWMSSNAALDGGLTRRLHRSVALIAALEDGTYPSKEELRSWIGTGDSVQLAFSALVSSANPESTELLLVVNAHHRAVSELRQLLRRDDAIDDERAQLVSEIRSKHGDEKIVAFSQYSDTIDAMFKRLSRSGQVAALTGSGGCVAGGRISRNDAIERFAPLASRRRKPRESERIDLLLTTDLLSEGVNLQDASVVIHLDLPWTPARMEQRLGRIARLGSLHSVVHAYAFRPPACEIDIVGIERILRNKMEHAATIVNEFPALSGTAFPVPSLDAGPHIVEGVRATLQTWLTAVNHEPGSPKVSCIESCETGYVAACDIGGQTILLANRGGKTSESPVFILDSLKLCESADKQADMNSVKCALSEVGAYLTARRAMEHAAAPATSANVRRTALRRIARAERECRPHRRAAFARLASGAREALAGFMGSAAEIALMSSMDAFNDDESWLKHVTDANPSLRRTRQSSDQCTRAKDRNATLDKVIAIVLFTPNSSGKMRYRAQ